MLAEIFVALKAYGYLGVFLINLISAASIILPVPGSAIVFTLGAVLNPLIVGAVGGFGSAVGELTGYFVGLGSGKIIRRKWKKQTERIEKLFAKYGGFAIIFALAATPLPDDIAGIAAGILKYPIRKFFFAELIGKLMLNIVLAYAGFYGINEALSLLG